MICFKKWHLKFNQILNNIRLFVMNNFVLFVFIYLLLNLYFTNFGVLFTPLIFLLFIEFLKFEKFRGFVERLALDNKAIVYHLEKDFWFFARFFDAQPVFLVLFVIFSYKTSIFSANDAGNISLDTDLNFWSVFFLLLFLVSIFLDMVLVTYIILYKNEPILLKFWSFCWKCGTKGSLGLGVIHGAAHVPGISQTDPASFYHKYSPIGRGYAIKSYFVETQVDLLKAGLDDKFDVAPLIDKEKCVQAEKILHYAQENAVQLRKNLPPGAHHVLGISTNRFFK